MTFPSNAEIDRLRQIWTGQHVRVVEPSPDDLTRFADRVGRVITVNCNGSAIVDFGDGAWYDIADFEPKLTTITDPNDIATYSSDTNSATARPTRQT